MQLARRILKLQTKYNRAMIELGRYYAGKSQQALNDDQEAWAYGAGIFSGLLETLTNKEKPHAD